MVGFCDLFGCFRVVCARARACVCMCMCARACVYACVYVCVCARGARACMCTVYFRLLFVCFVLSVVVLLVVLFFLLN